MKTVSYQQVLSLVSQIASGDGEPDVALESTINAFINFRVRKCWRAFEWPDLCPVERRWFRTFWSAGATYSAGAEVFLPEAGKYYQSLRDANTNHIPATLVGSDYVVDPAWWAECQADYEVLIRWSANTNYAVGVQLLNPADQEVYQCHTAHTSGASFDATKFGRLTPFVRYISETQEGRNEIGEVLGVYPLNPETNSDVRALGVASSSRGSIVVDNGEPFCWVRYRKPVPLFSGSIYDPLLSYSAGSQVFATSDYYRAATSAGVGVQPPAAPWVKLEFPAVLWAAVAFYVYADWLKSDGQHEKMRVFEALGKDAQDEEIDNILRQQNTHKRLPVRTR